MQRRRKVRFIAGAHCPKCQARDSIRLIMEQGIERIECVECDYSEVKPDAPVAEATRHDEEVIGVFKP